MNIREFRIKELEEKLSFANEKITELEEMLTAERFLSKGRMARVKELTSVDNELEDP